jgi:FkbM family methyltransferase
MNYISYSQNFEDVMLWRALKHINNGFYIDIGAQDPVIDSVSLLFYENGWRGVHIEPSSQYSKMIRMARPDEVVEQVAIGNETGNLLFYEFNDTGLSTADPIIAKDHINAGHQATVTEIPVISLDSIFEKYIETAIHWLKIDVEGMEKSVLQSWKFSICRPWILIIESTKPLSQEENQEEWESLVLEKCYSFAYFDGLNRFYIHSDHLYLLPFFKTPPNIFDGFMLSGFASQPFYQLIGKRAQLSEEKAQKAEAKAQEYEANAQKAVANAALQELQFNNLFADYQKLQIELKTLVGKIDELNYSSHHWWTESEQLRNQLQDIYNSEYWHVTWPIRKLFHIIRWFVNQPGNRLKRMSKSALKIFVLTILQFIDKHTAMKIWALSVLHKWPKLKKRLKVFIISVSGNVTQNSSQNSIRYLDGNSTGYLKLSPRAQQVYNDLKHAIAARRT